ncbi:Fanconi anemia core complex-associated protein 20 isoform X2 [Centrocercus urophasianus]|uniref:Fanconi anemia core complex-associated protein 20 isoform X2 n=1 Tax=Centrocercus urophasianus TaxID=9002 RepID=UPI001C64B6C9|nr:Fanconi anemia core complex-associated protein 20 isoform X2 [Centrocercus urophasianus]
MRENEAGFLQSRKSFSFPALGASTDRSSWFEKNDLNECEKTWSLLLRSISQDLQCTIWQTVPHFPEFFRKSSEEESLQNQEVFKVGMKDFHWTPFPAFHREQNFKPEGFSSPQLIETQTEHLHEEWDQEDELKSLPSASEQRRCKTNTDPKNMAWEDTRGFSKADADLKPSKDTQHKTSTCYLALSQRAVKAPSIQQHCGGTVQNSKENRKQEKRELQAQTHHSSTSLGETRSVPAERKPPLGSMAGNESCKENSGHQSEGSSTLDSCPMCLIRFNETLSQLDIDGHLARCLSESTDDIVW